MKRNLTFCLGLLLAGSAFAQNVETITFSFEDLVSPEEVAYADDVWVGTSDPGAPDIATANFAFTHYVDPTYYSWNGFTIAKVAADTLNYNGCMAKGGVAGVGTPYLLGYYSEYNDWNGGQNPQIIFTDEYEPLGFSVCSNPVAYNAVTQGDGFARKFAAGDYFTLDVRGLDENLEEIEENTLHFYMADCRDENEANWTFNKSWEWFDCSALGKVHGLSFKMTSTDVSYGYSNTAAYFCLDNLQVKAYGSVQLAQNYSSAFAVCARRDAIEVLGAEGVIEIYNVQGVRIYATTDSTISTLGWADGIYIIKNGARSVKVVK